MIFTRKRQKNDHKNHHSHHCNHHGQTWNAGDPLFDPQGAAYALFSTGLDVHSKRAAVGTANAFVSEYLGFFFSPPFIPPVHLIPAKPNHVVIYERKG